MDPNQTRVRVPMATFAQKLSDKKSAYDWLSQDCSLYMPDKDTVTIFHLRDLANGTKGVIKANAIKHLTVPYYKEVLTVDTILAWAKRHHPAVVERMLQAGYTSKQAISRHLLP